MIVGRATLPAGLAMAAVAVALLAQFGITQGSPVAHPGYGYILAVALFASAAFAAARQGINVEATRVVRRALDLPVRWEAAALVVVVGGAIFFRFFHFSSFPPGVWYDESIIGTDALSIIDKRHLTVWLDSNFGRASLYPYLMVVSFKTFGYTVFAFRIVPALIGVVTIIAFYFLARWLLDPIAALIATALFAVSRYAVTFSRISWDAALPPLLSVLSLFFFVRALETKRRLYFFLAGGSLAAGIYTYPSLRILPFFMVFLLAYILIAERHLILRNIPGIVIYGISFLIVLAPLGQFAVLHQDKFLSRTKAVSVFKEIDAKHSYQPLKDNIKESIEMMNVRGDANPRHNLPNAPMLDEVTGALFVLGLAVSVWSFRNWRRGMLPLWYALALVPGALTISIENPSAIRGLGSLPPLFLMVGLAIQFLYRTLSPARYGPSLFAVGMIALVGVSGALNYHQLFDEQAHSQAVYDQFFPVFTDVGQLAAREAAHNDVYMTEEFASHPVVHVLTRGKQPHVYNPSAQLAFPRSQRDALLIVDERDFAIIPTLQKLYPHLTRTDDVDPFGRTYFTKIRIPASDIDASHQLALSTYASATTDGAPVSQAHAMPDLSWSAADLAAGPRTDVFDGYLWVPTLPGNTTITLSSPGPVAVEIDGRLVAAGQNSVTTPAQRLPFGEHRVRLIATGTAPGAVTARVSVDGVATAAADALYAASAGDHGFQVVFRDTPDFSGPPALLAQVPFAIGAVPVGAKSVEYRGIFDVTMSGAYGFALDAGSSAQLLVDDALVVDNGGNHSPREVRGSVQLDAGPHTVAIQYTNPSPAPWALSVMRPGGLWTLADGSEFTPPTSYTEPAIVTLALDPVWGPNGRTSSGVAHPDGVTVLPDGSVVIGERGKLALLGQDGSERDISVPVTDIGDLAATPDGDIALLDSTKYSLYVVDATGAVLQHFDGVFASASGVDVAREAAYVASPRAGLIYRVPLPDGPVSQLPISSASADVKARQPSDIAVGPDGTLYVADFEKAQLVISHDGVTSQKTLGAAGTGRAIPRVALDDKLLLMTDPLNSRIIIFDLAGKQRGRFQFPPGVHATGIAVDADGRVYAADNESGRVYRLNVTIPESATDLQP